ncbi:unnamed protein product [Rotaria sp. Silwood2]|nr:unnamed protein product [Rotaria sp. Silwood2]
MNFFIQHTNVSLLMNENAVPDVRVDAETILNKLVQKNNAYKHLDESKDYMPAHENVQYTVHQLILLLHQNS